MCKLLILDTYVGGFITSDGKCTNDMISRKAQTKEAFLKKRNLLTSRSVIENKKELCKNCHLVSIPMLRRLDPYEKRTWEILGLQDNGVDEGYWRRHGRSMWRTRRFRWEHCWKQKNVDRRSGIVATLRLVQYLIWGIDGSVEYERTIWTGSGKNQDTRYKHTEFEEEEGGGGGA